MFYYDEVFLSIQGESRDSGIPTIFIRLYGCPVGCSYCDQPQTPKDRKRISFDRLLDKVKAFKDVKHICITGGEPLIQGDTIPLIYELTEMGYKVSIETSGCVPVDADNFKREFRYVMDIKCPSSGVSHKNIYDNLLNLRSNDEVKYVIANREDYDFMKRVMRKYPTFASVLVSPMFNKDNTMSKDCEHLVDWILEDNLNVRVQIQLHKILNVK